MALLNRTLTPSEKINPIKAAREYAGVIRFIAATASSPIKIPAMKVSDIRSPVTTTIVSVPAKSIE